jgi:hypothetical protein
MPGSGVILTASCGGQGVYNERQSEPATYRVIKNVCGRTLRVWRVAKFSITRETSRKASKGATFYGVYPQ